MPSTHISQHRAWWRGALSIPAVCGAMSVVSAEFWPDWPFVGPMARMTESVAPHIAVITILLGLTIVVLGGRSFGLILSLVALVGLGGVAQRHWARSTPIDPTADPIVSVLWYNMLHSNPVPPSDLIAALEESPADVILLTEATPLQDSHEALSKIFPVIQGCEGRRCDIMILARDPGIQARLQVMPSTGTERMGVVTLDLPRGEVLTIVGVHLLKPWFYGLSASDQWMVVHQSKIAKGPLVVVGDFNAAPWSKRLREIITPCELEAMRFPIPTWPARAKGLGVPIDLILTRGGAALRDVTPWGGAQLGSNHRGLLFEIGDQPGGVGSARPDCAVPQDMNIRLNLD